MLRLKVFTVFIAIVCLAGGTAAGAQRWMPYTLHSLAEAVREGGMTEDEAVARIREAGVSFRVDAAAEANLRDAGVPARVIAVASENMRLPAAWQPSRRTFSASVPLSEDDVLRALRRGISPDDIESAVERQGVTFRLDPATAERIELAGGSLSLIGMIGLRQPAAAQCIEAADVIVPARVVETAPVTYPAGTASGTVRVRALVARDGSVLEAAAADSHKLARAAENAVRSWTYEPARRGGRAIDSLVEAEVRFEPAE